MKNILSRSLALTGATLLAATLFASPVNAAPVEPQLPIQVTQVPAPTGTPELAIVSANLTPEEQEKVAAGDPMVITVDAYTGMIKEIEPLPEVQPLTSVHSTCSDTQACFYGPGVPYADYGFSGVGTAYGNWGTRASYGSQANYVSACSNWACYPRAVPK